MPKFLIQSLVLNAERLDMRNYLYLTRKHRAYGCFRRVSNSVSLMNRQVSVHFQVVLDKSSVTGAYIHFRAKNEISPS